MALFGGSKPDHPMADLKAAKAFIAELPARDFLKALDEVTFWLDSVNRTEEFKADYRFQLYDLLDQAAKPHQRKISQEYLGADRIEKFRENKLWVTIFEFWKTLGESYSLCMQQFQAGASGSGGLKKDLPALIGRLMRVQTLQLKWSMLRYGPVDDQLWATLGAAYLFAESKGISNTRVEVYPGVHGVSTVQQEFLKAMMLGVSSTDGLVPRKQEIAERAIAHFGPLFSLQAAPADDCRFYFDLSMRKPAARLLKNTEPTRTTRYFGAGKAMPALKKLIQDTQLRNVVPADVNLGGSYDVALVLGVLQHLARYWGDQPPARSSERRQTATRITVVHGYEEMVHCLARDLDAVSLDFHVPDTNESWIVENVSDGGYGAIIPQVKGDWIRVGTLLGTQSETSKYWGAGVVRRMAHDEHRQLRVGIQLLSSTVIPARIEPSGSNSSFNAGRGSTVALLLSTTPDSNGEVALLLNVGTYAANLALDMTVRGKTYMLMPVKLIEGGDDFDWASFKVTRS